MKAATILRPGRLLKLAGATALMQTTTMALAFAQSILLVRLLGADTFGSYRFLASAVAIIPVFYVAFDQSIRRFLPTAETDADRARILSEVVRLKLISFFLGLSVVGTVFVVWVGDLRAFRENLDSAAMVITFTVLVAELPIAFVSTTVTQTLLALQKFRTMILIELVRALLALGWVFSLFVASHPNPEENLAAYLIGRLLMLAVGTAYLVFLVQKAWPGALAALGQGIGQWNLAYRNLTNLNMRRYVLPLHMTTVGGFVADHFPSLVLGTTSSVANVTYYHIGRRIYSVVYKLVAQADQYILPALVRRAEVAPEVFKQKLDGIAVFYVLAYGCVALGTVVFVGPILSLWALPITSDARLLFFILSASMILNCAAHVDHLAAQLGTDMRGIILAALGRVIISAGVTASMAPALGLIAPALGQLLGTVWVYASWTALSLKLKSRTEKGVLQSFLSALAGLCILSTGYLILAQ